MPLSLSLKGWCIVGCFRWTTELRKSGSVFQTLLKMSFSAVRLWLLACQVFKTGIGVAHFFKNTKTLLKMLLWFQLQSDEAKSSALQCTNSITNSCHWPPSVFHQKISFYSAHGCENCSKNGKLAFWTVSKGKVFFLLPVAVAYGAWKGTCHESRWPWLLQKSRSRSGKSAWWKIIGRLA